MRIGSCPAALPQVLRQELLLDQRPFESLDQAQATVDRFVRQYNTERPHQALDMDVLASVYGCRPRLAAQPHRRQRCPPSPLQHPDSACSPAG
ncbi:integrase core domain-containing protein [Rhizocola hellebori]|uniref:integrase core domain-containing protein n=1 Tax=Rhizocola hellebori TaxID=1392758 RepID=UPI0035716B93